MGWAVAVDHEPRVELHDQMRVELVRQLFRDAGDADVPGDVTYQLALGQTEIAEPARNQSAVMITGEKERRSPRGVILADRGNIFGSQKYCGAVRGIQTSFPCVCCLSNRHLDLEM